jgi:hypothetical protein
VATEGFQTDGPDSQGFRPPPTAQLISAAMAMVHFLIIDALTTKYVTLMEINAILTAP